MDTHRLRLDAAARGDNEALAALVHAYHDRVYNFGRRVCRDGYDADDAVQEAFIRLSQRPDVMRHEGALAWLMTVVRNTCHRLLGPFIREAPTLGARLEEAAPAASDSNPQEALERWELVHRVHAAIAKLDHTSREVLIMRDLEGLSGPDTCAALGIDTPAMKSRLHRARMQLREALLADT